MKSILETLARGESLTRERASLAMELIVTGAASSDQTSAMLMALRSRGATSDELAGFATTMRSHATPVTIARQDLIDVCGTGGDGAGTFNISTTVALVLAGAGMGVAKHGNRAVSSRCGSADVLEALGVKIDRKPEQVAHSLDTIGFGFFFAPAFHPAMKRLSELRRALGVRTVFNLLGPLVNPARLRYQVLGVYDAALLSVMAESLREIGLHEAMAVASEDGLDELTISGKSFVAHLKEGVVRSYTITPEDAGLKRSPPDALLGSDRAGNARILEDLLCGQRGAKRDAVLLNAAAGLLVGGLVKNLSEGAHVAAESIDSGNAATVLQRLRDAA